MLRINRKLLQMDREGKKVQVALIGTGKMGRGLIAQMSRIPGMRPSVVVGRTLEKGKAAFLTAGVSMEDIVITNQLKKAKEAVQKGRFVLTEDSDLPFQIDAIQGVVDATGSPIFGAELAIKTLDAGKDLISLNVELDSVIGPLLLKRAEEKGLIYTGSAGDEPGAIMELSDFALGVGFDLLAVGKGKNNILNRSMTEDDLRQTALKQGLSPRMLTGFVDGTNTMIELTGVGNALGFVPDIPGCHGPKATPENLSRIFSLKEEGGILSGYGIVDFAFGMAPGVFAVVTSKNEDVKKLMGYLHMGEGPNFILHRPYHLTSLETPLSIYNAIVEREATIAPGCGQVCDTVAVAKKDLKKGESLEGIGGKSCYGMIVSHSTQQEENYVPMGLLTEGAVMKEDVKKDTWMTYAMVDLEDTTLLRLRQEQDIMEWGGSGEV